MVANLVLEIAAVVLSTGIIGVWRYQASIDRRLTELSMAAQRRENAIENLHKEKTYIVAAAAQTHEELRREAEGMQEQFSACRAQCVARSLQYARDAAQLTAMAERIGRLERAVDEIREILMDMRQK